MYDFRLAVGPGYTWFEGWNGWLYWSDGRRYRIVSGHVTEIHDLNGNITSIHYDFFTLPDGVVEKRPTSVTDALNRKTSITYWDTNGTSPMRDEITQPNQASPIPTQKSFHVGSRRNW